MITLPERELFHWRRARRNGREVAICRRITIVTLVSFGLNAQVIAAPTGGAITGGSGGITQSSVTTSITQTSQRLDIDWTTFSTGAGEAVNFVQPNNLAVAVNRVLGGVPSELNGALNANGRVFILNQAGIVFGASSQVNVGALLATTAEHVDVSALADGERYAFIGANAGAVANHGNITVSDGGFVILAAPQVQNTGYVQADLGEIHLAATTAYTLDLRGDGLINFAVPADAVQNVAGGVASSGTLRARSGAVTLEAHTVSDLVNGVVNLDGIIDADALVPGAGTGSVLLDARGDIRMAQGAEVHIHDGAGGSITLTADGNIDAGRLAVSAHAIDAADATIHASAGGHLSVEQASVSAAANHQATANIELNAAGDVNVATGLAAHATGTSNNAAPVISASVAARSDHGDITLIGDTLVVAAVHAVEGPYSDGDRIQDAAAYAGVNYSAARNLTVDGDVTAQATAYYGGPAYHAVANPHVRLESRDSGDVTLTGDLTVAANATRNVRSRADAMASAEVSAARNVHIDGSVNVSGRSMAITVGRSGAHTDGACMASDTVVLAMTAGTGGQGDLVVTDGIRVNGYASLAYGGTQYANAAVTVDLKAANDIILSGEGHAIEVGTTAYNMAMSGAKALAYTDLRVAAGTAGHGNISIHGDVTGKSSATIPDGRRLSAAVTHVDMHSPDDIVISGGITVDSVLHAYARDRGASGDARLNVAAGTDGIGTLTIGGNTAVSVNTEISATVEPGVTTALAQLTAPGDIALGGISVSALGDYAPAAGSDAVVDASLIVTAGDGGAAVVNGDVLVTAAAVNQGTAHALASANVAISAGGMGMITGDVAAQAAASAVSGMKSAIASVGLTTGGDLYLPVAPLADAARASVQGRESMSDELSSGADVYQASLIVAVGGVLHNDVPPPPEPPPSVAEPVAEAPVVETPAVDAPVSESAPPAPAEEAQPLPQPALHDPDGEEVPPTALPHKVEVTIISALNTAHGPKPHEAQVAAPAVEQGGLGHETPPQQGVDFVVNWGETFAQGHGDAAAAGGDKSKAARAQGVAQKGR